MSTPLKAQSTNSANQRALADACVLNDVLARVSLRWKMPLLYAIHQGRRSFGALKRELPSVSDHVLGRRLRELVAEGLVEKREAADGRGAYLATPRGVALLAIMRDICAWAAAEGPGGASDGGGGRRQTA